MSKIISTTWQDLIRNWLRENDRTQAWLCRQAALSETQFSKQMRGHREIDDYALLSLERAMGLELDTLVALKNSEKVEAEATLEDREWAL